MSQTEAITVAEYAYRLQAWQRRALHPLRILMSFASNPLLLRECRDLIDKAELDPVTLTDKAKSGPTYRVVRRKMRRAPGTARRVRRCPPPCNRPIADHRCKACGSLWSKADPI